VTGPVLASLLAISFGFNLLLAAAYIGSKRRLSVALATIDQKSDDHSNPTTPNTAARILGIRGRSINCQASDEVLDLSNLESRTPEIFSTRAVVH
jgi:hypothetical protein